MVLGSVASATDLTLMHVKNLAYKNVLRSIVHLCTSCSFFFKVQKNYCNLLVFTEIFRFFSSTSFRIVVVHDLMRYVNNFPRIPINFDPCCLSNKLEEKSQLCAYKFLFYL